MRIYTKIQLILEYNLDFQGFINIAQTHPKNETQPMVEFRVSFIRVTKRGQMFLQHDIFSHAPENSDHIQPQVILLCEHNIIMRILNKIQLILESNLDFQDLCQYLPNVPKNRSTTVPKNRSTTNGRILGQFCADDEMQPVFLRPDTFLYTAENGELIQPQVVFCCKYNVIIRIYTKIQPILESNLDFPRCFKIQCDSLSGCKS